ncbi:MAG: sigma-70 family RNA polymerase sigma factor [Chloracidobacterium sp.]|nr:sigma-70 family RNA polymerase sigma factor [Chloracidobacterium sp.]
MRDTQNKARWTLTADALDLLIGAIQKDGLDATSEYIRTRSSLVRYFETNGTAVDADMLADETLDRVAKQLAEGKALELRGSRAYFFAVARLVLLENIRRSRRFVSIDDPDNPTELANTTESVVEDMYDRIKREIGLDAVVKCRDRLSGQEREILAIYDEGRGREKIDRRNALAEKLGKTKSTLIVAVSRIRTKIKDCVRSKLGPDFALETL